MSGIETLIACTEARTSYVPEKYPTGPRQFMQKMCGASKHVLRSAKLVRGCTCTMRAECGVGACENVHATMSRNFSPKFEAFMLVQNKIAPKNVFNWTRKTV